VDVRTIGKAGEKNDGDDGRRRREGLKTVPAVIGPCTLMPFALNHRNSDALELTPKGYGQHSCASAHVSAYLQVQEAGEHIMFAGKKAKLIKTEYVCFPSAIRGGLPSILHNPPILLNTEDISPLGYPVYLGDIFNNGGL